MPYNVPLSRTVTFCSPIAGSIWIWWIRDESFITSCGGRLYSGGVGNYFGDVLGWGVCVGGWWGGVGGIKSTPFKHLLLRNHLANQIQISYEASMGWGNKYCSNGPGHMTKMATIPIYGKHLKKKKTFSSTKRPMNLNLGMHHRVLEF